MNILPKKRWHVRTKENIARVRRDEAKAVEEEKAREQRAKLAEQEARTNTLRQKAREVYDGRDTLRKEKTNSEIKKLDHVNFFKELEEGLVSFTGTNKEYELEKKEEREKYEKQIGYLTYLGQDSVESTGNVSWYNKCPNRLLPKEKNKKEIDKTEVNVGSKKLVDPLNGIKSYLKITSTSKKIETTKTLIKYKQHLNLKLSKHCTTKCSKTSYNKDSRHKHKTSKNSKKRNHGQYKSNNCEDSSSKSQVNLTILREKRLQREREENLRAERHLAKLRGDLQPQNNPVLPTIQQKYSSQFNPHLAKQNFISETVQN